MAEIWRSFDDLACDPAASVSSRNPWIDKGFLGEHIVLARAFSAVRIPS